MTLQKHTPGPWLAKEDSRGITIKMPKPYQNTSICSVFWSMRWTDGMHSAVEECMKADAMLIAAAPASFRSIEVGSSEVAYLWQLLP